MPVTYGGFNSQQYYKNPEEQQRKAETYIGIGVLSVIALGLLIWWHISRTPRHHGPPPLPPAVPVTSYQPLVSPTGVYKIDVPTGWIYKNVNNPGEDLNGEAFVSSSGAVFVLDDGNNVQSSEPAAVPASGSGDDDDSPGASIGPPKPIPLDQAHQEDMTLLRQMLGPARDGYPSEITTGLGPAYVSQFVAPSIPKMHLYWKLRGYHETIITDSRRVMVLCLCPDADWNTMQPGFWHIVNSVTTASSQ